MKKQLPVGHEDIKRIIDGDMYYVDKTMMIKTLIDSAASVNLFTRPRRFGKTLNLSMIRRFFELELDASGNPVDNRYMFESLKIASCGERYLSEQGQYPIINLSLKSAKQPDYEMAYHCLTDEIAKEYRRHDYVLQMEALAEDEKQRFRDIMARKGTRVDYATGLEFLSYCLEKYHDKRVIILIDEYDVPLENAYFAGFYDRMIDFIRSLFESALKTNGSLEFAVITGCLRISRESIFTGLNNLEIYSVTRPEYADMFGFTADEVKEMLVYYGLEDKYEEIKEWYDGYLFGNKEIYNPWSIINYVKVALTDRDAFPRPYWSNTSSNAIIKELIEGADMATRQEIESMIEGGTIEKPIHEDITYDAIHESRDSLWNFLYFTGYLKKVKEKMGDDMIYLTMTIPNKEIRSIYRNHILKWFDKKIQNSNLIPLLTAIENDDCEVIGDFLTGQLMDTISFFDYGENYYHGFLVGLLKASGKYLVVSNRESGTGRTDIIMKTPSVRGRAFILELKVSKTFRMMEAGCDEALLQIEKENYEAGLRAEGYSKIDRYGICFYRKECLVKKG